MKLILIFGIVLFFASSSFAAGGYTCDKGWHGPYCAEEGTVEKCTSDGNGGWECRTERECKQQTCCRQYENWDCSWGKCTCMG